MTTMELTTLFNMVTFKFNPDQSNTQYTASSKDPLPFPPPLQTEYTTNDHMATRRPQSTLYLHATLVLKSDLAG